MSALDDLNIKARWSSRKESIDECAQRSLNCLQKLAKCDDAFSHTWLHCGKSLREAQKRPVNLSLQSLRTYLADGGLYRDDASKTFAEELGFGLGRLWNGQSGDQAAHVTFRCGAYPDPVVLPAANECLIELPYGGASAERLLHVDKLREVIVGIITSWDPDWVRISTYAMDDVLYTSKHRGQMVGWLTYVGDRYGPLPNLPSSCEVVRIDGFGNLIIIRELNCVAASNGGHVELLRDLSERLKMAGLLSPIPLTNISK